MSTSTTTTRSRLRARESSARSTHKARSKPRATSRRLSRIPNGAPDEPKQCSLCQETDEKPMINCAECDDWFHFDCVGLSEDDAGDINAFVCPQCQTRTSRKTVMRWEGLSAVEEVVGDDKQAAGDAQEEAGTASRESTPPEVVTESEGDGSEDDYVDDTISGRRNGMAKKSRRVTISSDSEPDEKPVLSIPKQRRPSSASQASVLDSPSSPRTPHALKRKQSDAAHSAQTKKKRSRSSTTPAAEDPTRKYCRTKLEETFVKIFLRYPYVEGSAGDGTEQDSSVQKQPEELSDDDKGKVDQASKTFAAGVEEAIFEIYSEPDKNGKPSVAGKYKERFRMLTYNLGQDDRVALHRRIASLDMDPKILVTMSSTDLANEETKASIKIAEQESLAQTILTKTAAPRAKLTHKGLQDIEDVHGDVAKQRKEDDEEEERRERERLARVRPVKLGRQRAASGSLPPDSPIVPQTPSWGAPPPLPHHVMPMGDQMAGSASPMGMGKSPLHPLFVPFTSDLPTSMEPELNLADLINLDEETDEPMLTMSSEEKGPSPHVGTELDTAVQSTPVSPVQTDSSTTILPTSTSDGETAASPAQAFSLNAFWSAQNAVQDQGTGTASVLDAKIEVQDGTMDVELGAGETNDGDFDMFLEGDEDATVPPDAGVSSALELPKPLVVFEDRPQVWRGTLSMPLDSSIQEAPVVARQMAGRRMEATSSLWNTLFPSTELRIDGRVPVDKSSQYLLQMRLNSAKELIAVAFSAAAEESKFKGLMDHLVAKDRHGLVFPWGSRPKDYHPGKELYIIPLLSSEPLPEYMEMLDDLEIPKTRNTNYFVGIWVLNKGKLAAPPVRPAQAVPLTPVAPTFAPVPHPPSSQNAPSSVPPQPSIIQQVATLTPEQIQAMLKSLSGLALPPPAAPQGMSQLSGTGTQLSPQPPSLPQYASSPPHLSGPGPHPFSASPPPHGSISSTSGFSNLPPNMPPFPPSRQNMPPFPPTHSGAISFSAQHTGMPPFSPAQGAMPPFPPTQAGMPPFPSGQQGVTSFSPSQPGMVPPGPPPAGGPNQQWQPAMTAYPPPFQPNSENNRPPFTQQRDPGPDGGRNFQHDGWQPEGRGRGRGRGRGWERGGRGRGDDHNRGSLDGGGWGHQRSRGRGNPPPPQWDDSRRWS